MRRSRPVEVPVPAAVDELSLLDRVDYADAFRVDTLSRRTPEQWMRAIVEDAPRWFQLPWITLLGKGILRARFGPAGSPDHVLGGTVLVDRPDAFAIGLDGANGMFVRLITATSPGQAVFATQIQIDSTPLRMLWPTVRGAHRFFAPYLLDRAATRSTGTGGGTTGTLSSPADER